MRQSRAALVLAAVAGLWLAVPVPARAATAAGSIITNLVSISWWDEMSRTVTGAPVANTASNACALVGPIPPGTPATLTAVAGAAQVNLNWNPAATMSYPVTAYEIFRATCVTCSASLLTSVGWWTTGYTDTGVVDGNAYWYQVRGRDTTGLTGGFGPTAAVAFWPAPQLSVIKTLTPPAPVTGDPVTYTIQLTNTGGATITAFTVVDTVSSLITGVTTTEPGGIAPPLVASVTGGTRYAWSGSALSFTPGTTLTWQISGVAGPVCSAQSVSNTVWVSATDGVLTIQQVAAADRFTLLPPVTAISVVKLQTPPSGSLLTPGQPITYTIVVTNTGASTLVQLWVTDVAPFGTYNMSSSAYEPAGFPAPVVTSVSSGTQFFWSSSTLSMPPGASFTFTITGIIQPEPCQGGVFSSASDVWAWSACTFASTLSNTTTFTLDLPVFGVTARHDRFGGNSIGAPLTYLITVTNIGDVTRFGSLTIVDTVPAGMVNVTTDQPAVFGSPVVTGTGSGTRYEWSVTDTDFQPGTSFTFTITGNAGFTCSLLILAPTAQVTADRDPFDGCPPAIASATATTAIVIVAWAELSAVASMDPPSPASGDPVTYRIVVTNTGTATVTSLILADTLSPLIVGVVPDYPPAFGPPVVTQVPSGTLFSWNASGLSFLPGTSFTFTLTGTVGYVAVPTEISNSVFVVGKSACGSSSIKQIYTLHSVTPPPGTPPSAPATLVATGEPGTISLNWSPAAPGTYPVTAYEIFRATCGTCPSTLLAATIESVTVFYDFSAPVGVSSTYTVRAVDTMGQPGAFSPPATAILLALPPPPWTPGVVAGCVPALLWSRTFAVPVSGGGRFVPAPDAAGNWTVSSEHDQGGGALIWRVRRYDPAGSELWTHDGQGVPWMSRLGAAAVDGSGNAVAAGTIWTGIPLPMANRGVTKYDPAGNLLWSRTTAGGGYGTVTVDTAGNLILATSEPGPFGASGAVEKLNAAGGQVWLRGTGGGGDMQWGSTTDVATDEAGNVYATGWYQDTIFYPNGVLTVWKFDAGGNVLWYQTWDGPAVLGASGAGIAVDTGGNVVVVGSVSAQAGVVLRYDPSGNLLWSRTQGDFGTDVAVDGAGRAVTIGMGAGSQYWLRSYATNGALEWSMIVPAGSGVAVDPAGRIGVGGWSFGAARDQLAVYGTSCAVPPAAPLTMTALGGPGQIALNWSPAAPGTYPVTAYEIFRATCGTCGFSSLATVDYWSTTYADTGLGNGASFWYEVRARDTAGITGAFSATASGTVEPCTDPLWSYRAPMGVTTYLHGVAALGGRIYVAGGNGGSGALASVEAYDPATDTWTARAPLSSADEGLSLAAVGGSLYAVGGITPSLTAYDPTTNTWKVKAASSWAHHGGTAVAVGGKLYAIGGLATAMYTIEQYNPATDIWTPKALVPTPRYYLAASAVNGVIYVMGGFDVDGTPTSVVEAYNPATDTWATKASMPVALAGLTAAVVGSTIYVVGGTPASISTVFAYDPATNSWAAKCPLLAPRAYAGAASVGGTLYAVGGTGVPAMASIEAAFVGAPIPPSAPLTLAATGEPGQIVLNWSPATPGTNPVTAYEIFRATCGTCGFSSLVTVGYWTTTYSDAGLPTGSTFWYEVQTRDAWGIVGGLSPSASSTDLPCTDPVWSYRAPMGTARQRHAAAVLGGRIYVAGGTASGGGALSTVEAYDPGTNTWVAKASLPVAESYLYLAAVGGSLYSIPAGGDMQPPSSLTAYDPATDTWTPKASSSTRNWTAAVIAVGGKLYAIGGWSTAYFTHVLEEYDPVTDSWTAKATIPTPRVYVGATAVNGIIYVMGGNNGSSVLNTVEAYDPSTNTWTTKASMPAPREGLAAAVVGNTIFVVGGDDQANPTVAGVFAYDTATDTWTAKCPMQVPRDHAAAASIGGVLYAIGGLDSSSGSTWDSVEAAVVGPVPVPPSAPLTLTAVGGPGQIALNWSPAAPGSYPVTAYEIFRATCGTCGFTSLTTVGYWATTYADTGLGDSSSLWYEVQAFDTYGNAGAFGPIASAVVLPAPPLLSFASSRMEPLTGPGCGETATFYVCISYPRLPAGCGDDQPASSVVVVDTVAPGFVYVPGSLALSTDSGTTYAPLTDLADADAGELLANVITVRLGTITEGEGDPACNVLGQRIIRYRAVNAGAPAGTARSPVTATYDDAGGTPQAPLMGLLMHKAAICPPSAPVTVTALGGPARIDLNWSPATPGGMPITAYEIFRASCATCGFAFLAETGYWSTTWTDTGPFNSTQTYWYEVRARSKTGTTGDFGPVAFANAIGYRILAPAVAVSGVPFWITVTAVDGAANTRTDYCGTTSFTSTDPAATVSAVPMDVFNYTWHSSFGCFSVPNQNGAWGFAVRMTGPGSRVMTLSDTMASAIAGTVTILVDTPPTAPLTMTALGGPGQIALNWSPAADGTYPVTGYEIFRATCGTCGFISLATVGYWATEYVNTGIASGATCWYEVRARDTIGVTGGFSVTVSGTATPAAFAFTAVKTLFPAAPVVGGPVTYAIIVTNTGTAALPNLRVVDTVSPVVTGVSTDAPAGFGAPVATSVASGTSYEWTGGPMAAGAVFTFTITGIVGTVAVPTAVSNTAYLKAILGKSEISAATNVVGFVVGPAVTAAVLVGTLTVPAAEFVGNIFPVVLTVQNTGFGAASGVSPAAIMTVPTAGMGGFTSGPSPAGPVTIPAGGSASFTWTWMASKAGAVEFDVSAGGTDAGNGLPVTAPIATKTVSVTVTPTGTVVIIGGPTGPIDPTLGQTISFTIWPTGAGTVDLRIYDMLGILVRHLSAPTSGGMVNLYWDGRDDLGSTVPPGGYPVQILGPGINKNDMLGVLY